MTVEQLRQLLQALVDKPMRNTQLSIFTGVEGEDILSSLNKSELIAPNNNWNEEKEDLSIVLYLEKSTLSTKTHC